MLRFDEKVHLVYIQFVHIFQVNHSENFVNQRTGFHTQAVESYWNHAKAKMKRMYGCPSDEVTSYLDEFMWFHMHARGQNVETIMATLLRHIIAWPRFNPELN